MHTSATKVAVDLQRDIDGTAGNGKRLLVPQILDEAAKLVEHVKGWTIIVGKVRAMVDWIVFLGMVSDESYREQCPIICTLVELLQAMPNGSVENERGFSALNCLMDRLRNALQSYHLNVVLVLHNQEDKLLAPYSPVIVDFGERWFKGERGEAAGVADRAGSAVDNTAASGALEGAAAASGATASGAGASGTAASGGVASSTAATPGESDGDDIILGREWAKRAQARFADRKFR